MIARIFATLGLVTVTSYSHAQEVIPKIEYQGGHAAMTKRVKGFLAISDSALTFSDQRGAQLIAIPLAWVKELASNIDRKDASVGAKLAFGILARSRKDELVTVSYANTETAEGIVFKTDKNMSATLVAKIEFHLKRAGFEVEGGKVKNASRPPPTGQ